MRPKFTPDEEYILSSMRSSIAASGGNAFAWGYILGGTMLILLGMYSRIIEVIYIGCVLLISFRLYEIYYERKWLSVWRSVIDKYEQALSASDSTIVDAP